ncbi:hypothetical protein KKH43_06275 [Patescibacteria group bacterium]|nr:hypothetical protein [Patescibacteria group bacterium]MBU1753040.1 hypothetical protein [bacterium]
MKNTLKKIIELIAVIILGIPAVIILFLALIAYYGLTIGIIPYGICIATSNYITANPIIIGFMAMCGILLELLFFVVYKGEFYEPSGNHHSAYWKNGTAEFIWEAYFWIPSRLDDLFCWLSDRKEKT